jgi:G:T-mismatch repair DNA endonuclease (very short patch repair protein)
MPKTRRSFWTAKFRKNVARDARTIGALQAMGWRVAVIWECETYDAAMIERRLIGALPHPRRHP